MKLETVFIGAGLFLVIMSSITSFLVTNLNTYNVQADISTTFGKMTNDLQNLQEQQDDMRGKIKGSGVSEGTAEDDMFKGGYTAIRTNPYDTLNILSNSTQTLAKETGFLDGNIIIFLMYTMGALVTFAIIALIFRFRG